MSDQPETNKTIKDYYVWIDPEYALKHHYKQLDRATAITIALNIVKQRFENNGRIIPIEDGIYLSDNEEIIVDPKSFHHPLEMTRDE